EEAARGGGEDNQDVAVGVTGETAAALPVARAEGQTPAVIPLEGFVVGEDDQLRARHHPLRLLDQERVHHPTMGEGDRAAGAVLVVCGVQLGQAVQLEERARPLAGRLARLRLPAMPGEYRGG